MTVPKVTQSEIISDSECKAYGVKRNERPHICQKGGGIHQKTHKRLCSRKNHIHSETHIRDMFHFLGLESGIIAVLSKVSVVSLKYLRITCE